MDKSSRNFILWILAIHAALLILAAGVVAMAARTVYSGARHQAIAAAQDTQELLARETAAGIENYYKAVSAGIELLTPMQAENASSAAAAAAAEREPLHPPSATPTSGPAPYASRFFRPSATMPLQNPIVDALWSEIRQRASMLLLVELIHPLHPVIIRNYTDMPGVDPRRVVDDTTPWLLEVTRPSIGPLIIFAGARFNLVASPTRANPNARVRTRRVVVAIVPVDRVERELLQGGAERGAISLIDDQGVVVSDPDPSQIGTHRAMHWSTTAPASTSSGVESRALVTYQPIDFPQFEDRRWWLVISSGLDRVDAIVNDAFRDSAIWAGCLVISVTAILASTAIQLIRGRMRMERLRTDLLHRELEQARRIQLSWLPTKPLRSTRIELAAINRPASHVSGDFYDWFELPDGRIAVTVGDVTGHGLTAAFLMATTQLLVRSTMQRIGDPGHCLQEVNRQLCSQAFNGQFVTLLVMAIDFKEEEMLVATAGHPSPLVGSPDKYESLDLVPQFMLGIDRDADYPSQAFPLTEGQGILLYTDGVCDLVSPSGSRFSYEGLTEALGHEHESADSIINAVTAAVESFAAGAQLYDDLTLVAVRVKDPHAAPPRLAANS